MRIASGICLAGFLAACGTAQAQVNIADFGTGTFVPVVGPATFTQSKPADNAIGVIQTGAAVATNVTQTGFYNRTAVVQIGTVSTNAAVTQFGDFSRAIVVQVSPANTVAINQVGNNSTAIADQSAASPVAALNVAGLQTLVSSLLYAPELASAAPRLGMTGIRGFSTGIFARFDNGGGSRCLTDGPQAVISKSEAVVPSCPLAVFVGGGVEDGNRGAVLGSRGFDYTVGRIYGGLEVRPAPGFVFGPVVGVSRADATLDRASGKIELDSFQAGFAGSYAQGGAFVHAVAAYGFDSYRLSRAGFVGPVTATPAGSGVVAAAKAGYLFDAGAVQVGPVAALVYSRGGVDGYTEVGDALLTQRVARQFDESLLFNGGLRARTTLPFLGAEISPFIEVLAEHERPFDRFRVLQTAFSFAPGQTIFTPIRSADQTYGKINGGVSLPVASNLRFGLAAETTFARSGGDAFAFNAHMRLSF